MPAGRFFSRMPPAIEPGSMVVLTGARASWLLDFHARMRAIQRRGGFTKRAIRQKNCADAIYTLYTVQALLKLSPEPQEAAE